MSIRGQEQYKLARVPTEVIWASILVLLLVVLSFPNEIINLVWDISTPLIQLF